MTLRRGCLRCLHVLSWTLIAACAGFVVTIIYGMAAGYALPTAAIFRLFGWLADLEPLVPYAIVAVAAIGAGLGWSARGDPVSARAMRRLEVVLNRLWSRCGLPVIACLFLFAMSAGGWSGHVRSADFNYNSIAGLVPNSDALSYFADTSRLAFVDGHWGIVSSRRPLAQAFRQITVSLAQYSYLATLFIQAGMLAVLLFWAARRIACWRGIWAGIAFFGFVFLLHRPYLTTTMTEPLGLACALLALVHVIEALRQSSLPHALLALAALTAALLMRMGSLFIIPFLVLWIAFFVGGARPWRIVALGVLTVAMVVALQALLGWIYGSHVGVAGENFTYTICGLSLGTDWFDCLHRRYAAELAGMPDQRAIMQFVLARTWQNILQHPDVAAWRLLENAAKFVISQPRYLLPPSGPWSMWAKVMAGLGMLALVPGLLYVWRRRMSKAERCLWAGFFVSVLVSAAIIYADDGWRALHVTHVLAACFLASAFAAPGVLTIPNRVASRSSWQPGAVAMAVAAVLFLAVPMLARQQAQRELALHPAAAPAQASERIVLGAKHVSGFLVVPDDAVLPASPPALRVSDFVRLMQLTTLEPEGAALSRDAILKAPFAFVFAPDLLAGAIDLYVAPARLLEDASAWAWRIELRGRGADARAWKILREVVAAERLP